MKPSNFPGHYDQNRKFHYHQRNKNLIRRNNGKVLPYKDLPRECQLALAQYMSIDGEAWDAPDEVYAAYRKAHQHAYDKTRYHELMEQANNLFQLALPYFVQKYGNETFGYVEKLPLKELIANVMQDQDLSEQTWEEYHNWYMNHHPKHKAVSNLWPVILSGFDHETLEDGWTRFHQYAERGLEHCPAVWFPPDRKTLFHTQNKCHASRQCYLTVPIPAGQKETEYR